MKIGVLLTGALPDELAARFVVYAQMFADLFARIGGDFRWEIFDVRRFHFPARLNECDGYLITGSRCGVYEPLPWIGELEKIIVRCHQRQKPLAGICFGHQLIAQALGGKVIKSPKGWGLGLQEWGVIKQKPWMQPPLSALKLISIHQDQVVKTPPDATVLAASEFCPVAAYSIGGHIFCVQGHPEFTAEYATALYDLRRDKFAREYEAAKKTVGDDNDSDTVARWFTDFFQQAAKN